MISALFAHQGGWDEALLVLVPIGLFVGLLLLANKRAKAIQANLFPENHLQHNKALLEAVDNINFSHRDDVVKYVASGLKRNWKMRQELRSKRYTTRWDELYKIS